MIISIIILVPQLDHLDIYIKLIVSINLIFKYNTYKYYGLPPAPICNPGMEAIKAAANPADTNFLYFVASGDGGHNFAASLAEHNRNVKVWRQRSK